MSHDTAHARYSDWDGAYVLGALSPSERHEFEKHLEQCARCRAAVAELTPMPGLLARLSAERAEGILDDLPGSLLEGTLRSGPSPQLFDLVQLEDRRRARRRLRIWLTAAAAAVVVAAAIAVPLLFARLAFPAPQTLDLEALADVPLTASVTLTPAEWGTRLDLDCRYAKSPDGGAGTAWSYSLYVTSDDGTTSRLSTWRIAPGAIARISAASALSLGEIQSIEIRPIDKDEVLLQARVDG